VDLVAERRLDVERAGERLGERVAEVQEAARGEEVGGPDRRGDAPRPLRISKRLRPARDVHQATHEGAWGEDRSTNDVIEAVPDAGQRRARAEVHEAVVERPPDERRQDELMVEEDLVGPGEGQASETRDRRTRGRSGLRNEKGGGGEGLILVD